MLDLGKTWGGAEGMDRTIFFNEHVPAEEKLQICLTTLWRALWKLPHHCNTKQNQQVAPSPPPCPKTERHTVCFGLFKIHHPAATLTPQMTFHRTNNVSSSQFIDIFCVSCLDVLFLGSLVHLKSVGLAYNVQGEWPQQTSEMYHSLQAGVMLV